MKKKRLNLLLAGCLSLFVYPLGGHAAESPSVRVEGAWLRSPKPGEQEARLFMVLHNDGSASDKLVSVKTKHFDKAVIHADPSRIVVPHGIVIPPHASVIMEPGRPNVSLHDPNGETVVDTKEEFQLVFEKAGPMIIEAVVEPGDAVRANDVEARQRWEKAQSRQPVISGSVTEGPDEHQHHEAAPAAPSAN